jgi:hypothetical protein
MTGHPKQHKTVSVLPAASGEHKNFDTDKDKTNDDDFQDSDDNESTFPAPERVQTWGVGDRRSGKPG